ncbi:disease resistance protein RPP2B-like [Pistacia vera]|uniref:disease resistance protein RPP2B-like n=1 Tax=Pistacia vera TaxID=55513 RepID=UPI001263AB14|nr:disease resistance protein RPP2B-like [Pistacia vera]
MTELLIASSTPSVSSSYSDLFSHASLSSTPSISSSYSTLKTPSSSFLISQLVDETLPEQPSTREGNLKALKILEVKGIAIREVPPSITCLKFLDKLSLARCRNLEVLSFLEYAFPSWWLWKLDLTDCGIEVLPNDLGRIRSLVRLYLGRNNFESLPVSIKDLSNLLWLDLRNCEKLKSLPELPQRLETIEARGCTSLEALSGLPSLCPSTFYTICFINCFKLKLDELPDLKLHQLLHQLFFPEEEVTRDYLQRSIFSSSACICYPGSKIPEWFSLKSTGFEIKLPAGWLSDDLIGFAFCAVASFRDYQELGTFTVRFRLLVNEEIVSFGHLFKYNGHEVIESDHVFVGYDFAIMFDALPTLNLNSEGYIMFYVEHGSENSIDFSKVKKCGVRLLYAKDNYMGTDAKVDRDQRLKPIAGASI